MKKVLTEIVHRLQDRNIIVVAKKTGVSYNTIKNIRDGKNTNPTLEVLVALHEYLEL